MGTPETDKGSKGKCHQGTVSGSHIGNIQDELPCIEPPLPVLFGIEHDHRATTCPGCAVDSLVLVHGKREVGSVIRIRVPGHQFLLARQRQGGKLLKRFQWQVYPRKLLGIKLVSWQDLLEQLVQPGKLQALQLLAAGLLQLSPSCCLIVHHDGMIHLSMNG